LPGKAFCDGLNARLRGHYSTAGAQGNSHARQRFFDWAMACACISGSIGVGGNRGVSAGRASPSFWMQSPESVPASPSPGADACTLERPPCVEASPTEEPEAGNLHVRDCAGGAG
jgi:hypothetical protein